MPANPKTEFFLRRTDPDIEIFDSGPSRSKELDREVFTMLEARLGGTAAVRAYAKANGVSFQFMEADWVASSAGIHYVNYNAGVQRIFEWDKIAGVTTGRKWAGVQLRSGKVVRLGMNKYAAASLAHIAGAVSAFLRSKEESRKTA